jgi:hypothetical protein
MRTKYEYSFVNEKAHELEKKRLVHISKNKVGKASTISLSIFWLLVYLRGSTDKDKFKNAMLPTQSSFLSLNYGT